MTRRLLFRYLVGNEKCAECSDRNHDDRNCGLGLKPEYRPRGINLAITGVPSSDFDYRCDCREDTEAKDPPKCQLPSEAYLHIPQ